MVNDMNRFLPLGLIATLVNSGFAYPVQVKFDPGARFSNYKTFRLVHGTGAPSSRSFPIGMNGRLEKLIQEQLAGGGLEAVATGGDLIVSYRIYLREDSRNINLSDGVGPTGLGTGNAMYTATVRILHDSTLVVNFVDARQNIRVFEGTLTQSMSASPEKNARKLEKAAKEILETYPPRP